MILIASDYSVNKVVFYYCLINFRVSVFFLYIKHTNKKKGTAVPLCFYLMRTAAAATGSKRWFGKPDQQHQHQEDTGREPENFVRRDNQPLVGDYFGDIGR